MGTTYATITIFLVAATGEKFDADYCADYSKCANHNQTMDHLLCKFKHETSKGDCTNIRGRMTPDERMHILAFHNLHRNELGMDPTWVKYPRTMHETYGELFEMFARPSPDNWLTGFGGALCIRQLTWAYENEKSAQIWAEQCAGDEETYNCITDFKERFPQFMSVYTTDGIVEGETAMSMAFEHWRATNKTMKGIATPETDTFPTTAYDENNLRDFRFDEKTPFLPWASMSYSKTFLLGCGKAHFSQGGKEKTRIVCVYGPGINYIEEQREKGVEDGAALYVSPDNATFRQCTHGSGHVDPDLYRGFNYGIYFNSCPLLICSCRGAANGVVLLNESSWPWLCADDCQLTNTMPGPIPSLMEYVSGATAGVHPVFPLVIGLTVTQLRTRI